MPRLIHPVRVVIAIPDNSTEGVVFDKVTKQPIGGINRFKKFVLPGQITFSAYGGSRNYKSIPVAGGTTDDAKGYIQFLTEDLIIAGLLDVDNPNVDILMDAKVEEIGRKTKLNYFISQVEDNIHYSDGSEGVKCRISDQSPGRSPRMGSR